MSFDVDWEAEKHRLQGVLTLVLAVVLAFLIVSYALPWAGMVPHRLRPSHLEDLGSDWQARIVHETTMTDLTNETQVMEEAGEIRDRCGPDRRCFADEVERLVSYNITYTERFSDEWPEPEVVLERGEGRCVGKSVVAASLLETLGFDAYYAYQDEHICVMYESPTESGFVGCYDEEFLLISEA